MQDNQVGTPVAPVDPVAAPATHPDFAPAAAAPTAVPVQPVQPAASTAPNAAFGAPAAAQKTDNSFWIKVIIFFNPMVAVIYYLLKRENEPELARRALGTAWFAVVFWFVVLVVLLALYFLIFGFAMVAVIAGMGTMGSELGNMYGF
ncbi:MAG: hypothetical protein FWE46_05330 [Coriobacteriia bacterium]|nr:hypothetical protein [Coriobacteriia bacterium]